MPMIFKRASEWRWIPDADDVGAPDGALLRADNTTSDEIGSRSVRQGSRTVHSGLVEPVTSMRTATLNGTAYLMAGAGDSVFIDGDQVSQDLAGVGDIAFGDDSYQSFFARGTSKKKWDGESIKEWGIAAPASAPTLGAIDAVQYYVCTFGSGVNTATKTATTIAFVDSGPDTITDSGAGFIQAGFTPGSLITVTGGPNNGKVFTAASVTAGTITLIASDAVTAAAVGASIQLDAFGEYEAHGPLSGPIIDSGPNALILKEGLSGAYIANYADTAGKAYNAAAATASGIAAVQKTFASDIDLLTFPGSVGGDEDLFDMRVWLENPRVVDKVTVMFGLNTGADPFLDDYYYFDFNIRNTNTINLKDADSASSTAYAVSLRSLMTPSTPQDATAVKTAVESSKILRDRGRFAGARSKERPDSISNSPAWGHMTVTRAQFSRTGGTPGRDWKTVRGFKVVYTVTPGATNAKIGLDDAIWTGGGNRALNGTFNVGYRFARRVLDNQDSEIYTELSPMSPISQDIVLRQQTLQITIPSAAIEAKDPQVDLIWIYVFGGWMDTYYRFAVVPATVSSDLTIDDIWMPTGNLENEEWNQMRFASYSFLYGFDTAKPSQGSGDLVVRLYKSELEALTDNVPYDPGSLGPPDNIISIAGPLRKRIYCLTGEGWLWPSTIGSPSSFNLYQAVDLRMYGTPYWVINTPSGLFVGCSKDIIKIDGTGEDIDLIQADIFATPLTVANPPVDRSVGLDGNMIFYRAADGPMTFAGSSSQSLPYAGTSLLWSGRTRYGVSAIDTTNGRFRYAIDNHKAYMLVSEGSAPAATIKFTSALPKPGRKVKVDGYEYVFDQGVAIGITAEETTANLVAAINANHPYVTASTSPGTNIITLVAAATTSKLSLATNELSYRVTEFETRPTSLWRYSDSQWCRFVYGSNVLMSLYREPDGSLLVGTLDGKIIEIETGFADDTNPIQIEILTPNSEGGTPLSRKDPADMQLHVVTGGSSGTIDLFRDRAATPSLTKTFSTLTNGIYRMDASSLGPFIRLQAEIYGAFTGFSIHALALSHTNRPQHAMVVDLGSIIPESGADLAWIKQAEIDVCSDHNLNLFVYKDGTLHTTQLVTVAPGIRDVYTVVLPRDTKGRRLSMILKTTAADSEGFNGMELYSVKVVHTSTGNRIELPVTSGDDRSDQ